MSEGIYQTCTVLARSMDCMPTRTKPTTEPDGWILIELHLAYNLHIQLVQYVVWYTVVTLSIALIRAFQYQPLTVLILDGSSTVLLIHLSLSPMFIGYTVEEPSKLSTVNGEYWKPLLQPDGEIQ